MSVQIKGQSVGTTTVEIEHGPSGARILTTAPRDNGGDGSSFSPTDLCSASLGACGCTIMSMFAKNKGIPVNGIRFCVEKHMTQAPRKIGRIVVKYEIDTTCSEGDFEKIVAAGRACPVRITLADGVSIEESYERTTHTRPA